ncbi:Oligosaccaryltransferase-domain-containing protein [Absidia repens]|uniref:Dolichyl-diphosphooligosaccharide--protein glycosyltransferase subunit 4 n=1 Tax=Absidia repens TaxID=90262 RepID=A0A1X2J0Z3_9FUNG|nr:Oligosaccaryltransferase-domain-containing protein [Absidia repens]
MISDTQLSFIANSFGVFAMILIVVYHYIAVNDKKSTKSKIWPKKANGPTVYFAYTAKPIYVLFAPNASTLTNYRISGSYLSFKHLRAPLDLRQLARDPSHNVFRVPANHFVDRTTGTGRSTS